MHSKPVNCTYSGKMNWNFAFFSRNCCIKFQTLVDGVFSKRQAYMLQRTIASENFEEEPGAWCERASQETWSNTTPERTLTSKEEEYSVHTSLSFSGFFMKFMNMALHTFSWFVFLLCCQVDGRLHSSKRPNILLVLNDDQDLALGGLVHVFILIYLFVVFLTERITNVCVTVNWKMLNLTFVWAQEPMEITRRLIAEQGATFTNAVSWIFFKNNFSWICCWHDTRKLAVHSTSVAVLML